MIITLKGCQKEIAKFPEEVRGDLADALACLQEGQMLSMPLSRPMPSIGRSIHELRFRDRDGIYRIIYCLAGKGGIYLLHAFQKKTRETLWKNIAIAKKRLKEIL